MFKILVLLFHILRIYHQHQIEDDQYAKKNMRC